MYISRNSRAERYGVLVNLSVLVVVCSALMYLFSKTVPDPYMDEVFHIPQAQRFCSGNFSFWDPMITTPPGLYSLSVGWAYPVSYLLRVPTSHLCTVTNLRALNVVFTLLLFVTIYGILKRKSEVVNVKYLGFTALTLTLFPVLYFFSFLYYTDVGATLLVLWGYYLGSVDRHWSASLVLVLSMCFRQTSVVWLVFVAGDVFTSFSRRVILQGSMKAGLKKSVISVINSWPRHFFSILCPYIIAIVLFLNFIFINGSLAMGDKTNHTLSFHLPQLFYFCIFTCFFSAPRLLSDWWNILKGCGDDLVKRPWKSVIMTAMMVMMVGLVGMAVHFFTYAHPYLLADNRHYPFYLWKNIVRRHWLARYLLAPLYVLSAAALVIPAHSHSQDIMWLLLYSVCCFTALVPQRLVEFRYYIIPYLIFRIHVEPRDSSGSFSHLVSVVMEFVLHILVNFVTISLFIYKPFSWPDSTDLQRFMW